MNISLRGVSKGFDRVTAVDRVTLEIADGELFTLLGPSGCGKTTLLRLIAGFGAPDTGEIWFGERRVDQLRPYERNIGMVFQNYALWPHMTARANITYGLRLRKLDGATIARRLAEGLRKVKLAGLEDRYPGPRSGGGRGGGGDGNRRGRCEPDGARGAGGPMRARGAAREHRARRRAREHVRRTRRPRRVPRQHPALRRRGGRGRRAEGGRRRSVASRGPAIGEPGTRDVPGLRGVDPAGGLSVPARGGGAALPALG